MSRRGKALEVDREGLGRATKTNTDHEYSYGINSVQAGRQTDRQTDRTDIDRQTGKKEREKERSNLEILVKMMKMMMGCYVLP